MEEISYGEGCGSENPHETLLRAVRLCHPGGNARITFEPGRSWGAWIDACYLPILAPALDEALSAAARRDGNVLREIDRALDAQLPAETAAASRQAGHDLAAARRLPDKFWERHCAACANNATPGHLAVLAALRAAIFHLSPAICAGAYLVLEARGGAPRRDAAAWTAMATRALEAGRRRSTIPRLRAA